MAIHSAVGASRRATRDTNQYSVFPAPRAGIDARANIATNSIDTCITANNLVPSEYGMKIRPGYRLWQTGLAAEVRTIIPYAGEAADRTDDRIFAITPDGIYDVTTDGGTPVNKLLFTETTGDAGFGVYSHYVDGAGNDLLFYADAANGLFEYDRVTDTWAQTTDITATAGSINAFDATEIVYIVSHKLRLWLVPRNSTYAWYLPILSAKGEAEEFFFGAKFKHGGELVGLYNWTVDGGDGVDDKLVAVSKAGDVIPYQGEDPSLASWSSIGTYFIGTMPKGVRCCSEYGGDLYMLSTLGLTSMRNLLSGHEIENPTGQTVGFKIARFLRNDLRDYGEENGWDLKFVTQEGEMLIVTPQRLDATYRQYAYNLTSRGWGFWRDVPILSGDPWLGRVVLGDKSGNVWRMDVNVDAAENNGANGTPIKYSILTGYSDMGTPGRYKRVQNIRPNWAARLPPTYSASAKYDYDVTLPAALPTTPVEDAALWDVSNWDQAFWESGVLTPEFSMQGARGHGRTVAIAMIGESTQESILASWDIAWNTGHFR